MYPTKSFLLHYARNQFFVVSMCILFVYLKSRQEISAMILLILALSSIWFWFQAFTGDIKLIPESQKITDIRNEDFDKFLANEESVAVLVNCFLSIQTCPHPSIVNMLSKCAGNALS